MFPHLRPGTEAPVAGSTRKGPGHPLPRDAFPWHPVAYTWLWVAMVIIALPGASHPTTTFFSHPPQQPW